MENPPYLLPDARLVPVLEVLIERVSKRLTLVVSALADFRKEVLQFGRFVRNKRVDLLGIHYTATLHMNKACEGRSILLIQDTSEASFGFQPFQKDLGPVGGGKESGFFLHPVLAMDADTKMCIGLAHVEIYKRESYGLDDPNCDPKVRHANKQKQAFQAKSSYRWLSSVVTAKMNCLSADQHTVVSDREGDIYEAFCGYMKSELDFIVRSGINRALYDEQYNKLWIQIQAWSCEKKHSYEVDLPRTDKCSAHKALLKVRFGQVNLKRPTNPLLKELPECLAVYVLEVLEDESTVIGKEKPIHWILYTSHPVTSMQQAMFIIGCYVKRWSIEQVFRTLKSQGLNLEESMAKDYKTLTNLALLGLLAAIKVMQLVSARADNSNTPIQIAFSSSEVKLLEQVSPTLEGATLAQKNPYPKKTIAFAAWVIARLGGWKGYAKERPPGPIRMLKGLKRFENYMETVKILNVPLL